MTHWSPQAAKGQTSHCRSLHDARNATGRMLNVRRVATLSAWTLNNQTTLLNFYDGVGETTTDLCATVWWHLWLWAAAWTSLPLVITSCGDITVADPESTGVYGAALSGLPIVYLTRYHTNWCVFLFFFWVHASVLWSLYRFTQAGHCPTWVSEIMGAASTFKIWTVDSLIS